MFPSDWALKEQTIQLFISVCVTQKGRGEFSEGPSPDLKPISMQMVGPELKEVFVGRWLEVSNHSAAERTDT